MGELEPFERKEMGIEEAYRHDAAPSDLARNGSSHADPIRSPNAREPVARAAGSPLPMGSSGKTPIPIGPGAAARGSAPPPGRALSVPPAAEPDASSGMQWLVGFLKQAAPFVQRLLPLLDGHIATAVSNVLTSRPQAPAAPRVDLQPIERSLSELQIQQHNLKDQLNDQNASLKRVEDQLEMVREATDRNTLEQQELIEDLKAMGGRVNLLALLFLALLVISVLLNIFLFLHIQRVLP